MSLSKVAPGMTIDGVHVVITEKKVGTTKTGKPYADIVVRDSADTLKCKMWNYTNHDSIAIGKVIVISGEISAYQGENQCVISGWSPSDKSPTEFFKRSRFPLGPLETEISDLILTFKEPLTAYVAKTLFERYAGQIAKAPAASGVHNAWVGGLLEHINGMCTIAYPIMKHYATTYKAPFSSEKVYFGLIFHDLGKIFEYDMNNPAFPHTPSGVLVNHLVTGPALVYEACSNWFLFNDKIGMTAEEFQRERNHLMHILASHHGQIDWGSPVVPSTLEAVLVHQIDMIDSRFMHALELVEGKEGNIKGFSEKSWTQKTCYMQGKKNEKTN